MAKVSCIRRGQHLLLLHPVLKDRKLFFSFVQKSIGSKNILVMALFWRSAGCSCSLDQESNVALWTHIQTQSGQRAKHAHS
jgi:hypothetical protein